MELIFHTERNILQPFPVADALMCLSYMTNQAVFPLCSAWPLWHQQPWNWNLSWAIRSDWGTVLSCRHWLCSWFGYSHYVVTTDDPNFLHLPLVRDVAEIHSHYHSAAPSPRLGHLSTVAVILQACSMVTEKETGVLGIKMYSSNKRFEE